MCHSMAATCEALRGVYPRWWPWVECCITCTFGGVHVQWFTESLTLHSTFLTRGDTWCKWFLELPFTWQCCILMQHLLMFTIEEYHPRNASPVADLEMTHPWAPSEFMTLHQYWTIMRVVGTCKMWLTEYRLVLHVLLGGCWIYSHWLYQTPSLTYTYLHKNTWHHIHLCEVINPPTHSHRYNFLNINTLLSVHAGSSSTHEK